MNLNYTPEADADLDAIHAYIGQHDPGVARQVVQRILQSVAILENFPLLGRPGRIDGTREFPISNLPYFAVYRIPDETQIDVIAVIHMAVNSHKDLRVLTIGRSDTTGGPILVGN